MVCECFVSVSFLVCECSVSVPFLVWNLYIYIYILSPSS